MPRVYSYVVARDYGFAPNPFHGFCTLATCKPVIRKGAQVGDWVIGTGAKSKYNLGGRLIFAMQVSEAMTFTEYWNDSRFQAKRPVLHGSLKLLYGDNIYHRETSRWVQSNSHHSLADGRQNRANIKHDTQVDRVLISQNFVYLGSNAVLLPAEILQRNVCAVRGHRVLEGDLAQDLVGWITSLEPGMRGLPLEFAQYSRAAPTTARIASTGSRPGKL